MTARAAGGFQPATNIDDARQRWLFRMVHSQRPLQEKMALFWHNHFATAYSKIAGAFGAAEATRMFAAKPTEDPNGVVGQLELFRQYALGNFRDLLVAVAKDPAMLVWLDGRAERPRPAAGELRARADGALHDGRRHVPRRPTSTPARASSPAGTCARPNNAYYAFTYNAGQHDTDAKEFSFPIYPNGSRTIPARAAAQGMQDGIDLIDAVARHPATGPRLARKLYDFFINETDAPDAALIAGHVADLLRQRLRDQADGLPAADRPRSSTTSAIATSATRGRSSSSSRSLKEVGWNGFSLANALTPLAQHGAAALRAAGRRRLGARAAAGSRAAACWRG